MCSLDCFYNSAAIIIIVKIIFVLNYASVNARVIT